MQLEVKIFLILLFYTPTDLCTHVYVYMPISILIYICICIIGLLPVLAESLRTTFGAVILTSYGMTECMPISSQAQTYRLDPTGRCVYILKCLCSYEYSCLWVYYGTMSISSSAQTYRLDPTARYVYILIC
jgi:uncharacterized membrane protein